MGWAFEDNRPIYTQLLEHIQTNIISGAYPIGSKLPSVRELAQEASVNPNTMQKALSELERSGLIYSQRTAGRFVTEDAGMIRGKRAEIAEEKIRGFIELMKSLGFEPEHTLELIHEYLRRQ